MRPVRVCVHQARRACYIINGNGNGDTRGHALIRLQNVLKRSYAIDFNVVT